MYVFDIPIRMEILTKTIGRKTTGVGITERTG